MWLYFPPCTDSINQIYISSLIDFCSTTVCSIKKPDVHICRFQAVCQSSRRSFDLFLTLTVIKAAVISLTPACFHRRERAGGINLPSPPPPNSLYSCCLPMALKHRSIFISDRKCDLTPGLESKIHARAEQGRKVDNKGGGWWVAGKVGGRGHGGLGPIR